MSYTSLDFLGNDTSYISVLPANLSFGTGDFTIEWWQYETVSDLYPRPFSIGSFPNAEIAVSIVNDTFYFWSNSGSFHYFLLPSYFNTWLHFAIVRQGDIITIYLNGNPNTSFSDTINYVFSENLTIGNETDPNFVSTFRGQIYNFEWLIGTAKYSSPFTPSINLPSDPNSYTLILNGNYTGGSQSASVTNFSVGQSSNIPVPIPSPPPISGLNINPLNKRFGSISFGNFWYGNRTNFPGFLYKKNVGVGGRRSTKMAAGGNITCNSSTYLYNKYKPGSGGVGASSIANRRAKNRHATVCSGQKCFPCYMTLGQYSNYTHNPNGYVPCLSIIVGLVSGNVQANMNTNGMRELEFTGGNDDGFAYLPFIGMDFFFFGTNYGDSSNNNIPGKGIYMNTNYAFGFDTGHTNFNNWPEDQPAILFDFFDSINFASYVYPNPQNGSVPGTKYVRIVATGTDYNSYSTQDPKPFPVKKAYEIYYIKDEQFQYMQFNCSIEDVNRNSYNATGGNISNITNGSAFQNTLGAFGDNPTTSGGPQTGGSYVLRSDLNGNNWQFFPNYHVIF